MRRNALVTLSRATAAVRTKAWYAYKRSGLRACVLIPAAVLPGCAGAQSAFNPFGAEAEATRGLAIGMVAAATVLALGVYALAGYAVRAPANRLSTEAGMRLILWLGAIGPTVLLTVLLLFALPAMRTMASSGQDLRVSVTGEQFWWRVRYSPATGSPVDTANEIRVPVGRTVVFTLAAADVVHSFWIPGLAGKVDMIPGRTNTLVVKATRPGVFRGVCAEFCGLSHARMAFDVVAMEPVAFDRWLVDTAKPAVVTASGGQELFSDFGCGGCHAVRGSEANGLIGPDLTHFGSRRSFGAGTLPISNEAVAAFIRDPKQLKPGVHMPAFGNMSASDARALASYLEALR